MKEEFIGKCDFCDEIFYTENDELGNYPEKCPNCIKERNRIKLLLQ